MQEAFTFVGVGADADARYASADASAGVRERGKCTEGHTGTCEGSLFLEVTKPLSGRAEYKKSGLFSRSEGTEAKKKKQTRKKSKPTVPGV